MSYLRLGRCRASANHLTVLAGAVWKRHLVGSLALTADGPVYSYVPERPPEKLTAMPPPVSVNGFVMSQTTVFVYQSSRPPLIRKSSVPVLAVRSSVAMPRRDVALSLIVAVFPVSPERCTSTFQVSFGLGSDR
jgi:hypothetical protein